MTLLTGKLMGDCLSEAWLRRCIEARIAIPHGMQHLNEVLHHYNLSYPTPSAMGSVTKK